MQSALRMEAVVLPGHRVEVRSPELPEGVTVEVIVVLPPGPGPAKTSMLEFVRSLPPGPAVFQTPEEADRFIREERDAWE
jgi:hypothetical protein